MTRRRIETAEDSKTTAKCNLQIEAHGRNNVEQIIIEPM